MSKPNLTLKLAIVASGERQSVIAAKAGLTEARLSWLVTGRAKGTAMERRRVARALRRTVGDLFPEHGPENGQAVA